MNILGLSYDIKISKLQYVFARLENKKDKALHLKSEFTETCPRMSIPFVNKFQLLGYFVWPLNLNLFLALRERFRLTSII